jgi:membrane-associated phospholipid phosphatase
MRVASKVISWIFLPLLAPVYAIAIAMYVFNLENYFSYYQENCLYVLPDKAKEVLMYLFAAFSFFAPALTVLFLQTRGSVSSVMMEKRTERIIPSIMVVLFGISLLAILLYKVPVTLNGSKFLFGLALGSLISVIVCTLLTFRWKVSLHATGMGILTGFLFVYYSQMLVFPIWILVLAFLASGIVMSARMYLKLHSLSQLLVGYTIGFVGVASGMLYFLYKY